MTTTEPDTAYFYDAGLSMTVDEDRRTGGNMESSVSFYDTAVQLRSKFSNGPERQPEAVRYRTVAAHTGAGSVAVFPAPHEYFFPRDFTTNMGYVWHSSWKGQVALGIRQLPDDATAYYPWSNAPPHAEQRMSMFLLLDPGDPPAAIAEVLRFTHSDRFPALDGYVRFAPHWHYAYTVQAIEHGAGWVPPFKPVLQAMGVDTAMIMDFHGDGHPADIGETRLTELAAYYRACHSQSGPQFLLIPAEEANVHFGGHWAVAFPKPVYWRMSRKASQEFREGDPQYEPYTTWPTQRNSSTWYVPKTPSSIQPIRVRRDRWAIPTRSGTAPSSRTRAGSAPDGRRCLRISPLRGWANAHSSCSTT
jgi:hypothetical protein